MSTQPSVLIIGAGLGGIGVAAHLARAGFDDVTLLDRGDGPGGVWRDNTYPGAACDVPSSLYSYSFAPKPDWGRRYGTQPDILGYVHAQVDALGLRPRIHTEQRVVSATWDADALHWRVVTDAGREYTADVLVPATGQLSDPVIPRIDGAASFAGPAFHSAQWRHDVDLTGKRVAVIGTGASAIQFVPAIVDDVAAMTVFQRSAPYVVPKPDRAYTRLHHAAFAAAPRSQAFGRTLTWVLSERLNAAMENGGVLPRILKQAWRAHLRLTVKDPAKRKKLVPDYPLGCKRLLFANTWYPAIDRDHVGVVTEQITAIEPGGVRTSDGTLHEVDVLIWGTGFAATDFLGDLEVRGTATTLQQTWSQGAHAHLGITVAGFPNLFWVYGPNTNLGGGSIVSMMEAQAGYITQAVQRLAGHAAHGERAALEVRPEAAERYDAEMQRRLGDSVWNNCASWYRTAGGRIINNWPGTVAEYQRRTGRLELADFTETVATPVPGKESTPA
ncbi:NAD(P)/FAD-dependent oxidoreductase [Nocardioides dubius]|uniref:NAD(P)/FAD-dependent oxidoreductase n=1 Tax=Nocardioides dubius TaxID=317019 RepID=A0ABN1U211_9ACTN